MITHEAFVRDWMVTAGIWETTAEDRQWSALPLFHVTALGCVTWVLGTGATFFSDYSFDADAHAATRCATSGSPSSIPPTSRSWRPCSRTRTSPRPT